MVEFAAKAGASLDYKQLLLKLLEDVSKSSSIEEACLLFDSFLSRLNCRLLSVKFHDSQNKLPPLRPFSAYPAEMRRFRGSADYLEGCPFNREARIRLRPFSLASINRSKYPSLMDRQFFHELDSLGHNNIAVLPVMVGRGVSLMTVGLFDQPFEGRLRVSMSDAATQIVAAVVARFPQVSKIFEKKVLSALERQVLTLACAGKSHNEIETEVGLSPATIDKIKQNIALKLSARNEAETVFRAMSTGEIGSVFSETVLIDEEH